MNISKAHVKGQSWEGKEWVTHRRKGVSCCSNEHCKFTVPFFRRGKTRYIKYSLFTGNTKVFLKDSEGIK